MRNMKRVLSFVLALVMIVGLLPASVFAADVDTDYLFFATDRHANTSVIGNIINNMESVIGENELEYLGLGGDMDGSGNSHPAYNSSTVLSEVTGATSSLSATNVDIVGGIHDMNVIDYAGIVLSYNDATGKLIYTGDKYYVYGVPESCISEDYDSDVWSAQAQAFVDWANGDDVDKSKVIIVLSHYPLHAKRDDNDGAYYWHQALNTVATGSASGDSTVERNIVFFHGHNHTVDSKEYVYNVGDTMSIQNGSSTTSEAIYYTYATAGYLNQNSKATLMAITDTTITLTKYSTSGSGTAMTSVERVATTKPETLAVSGKINYALNEQLADPTSIVVTYDDGSEKTLSASDLKLTITTKNGADLVDSKFVAAGTYDLTYSYTENGQTASATLTVYVNPITVSCDATYTDDTTSETKTNGDTVTVTGNYLTGVTAAWNTTDLDTTFNGVNYKVYDVAVTHADGCETGTLTITLDVVGLSTSNLKLYSVVDGVATEVTPTSVAATETGVQVTFTAAAGGTFAVGNVEVTIPEGATLDSLTVLKPNKLYYFDSDITTATIDGEEKNVIYLDITGMVVTANYVLDGVTYSKEIEWDEFGKYTDGYSMSFNSLVEDGAVAYGTRTATVAFGGKTATFDVYICKNEDGVTVGDNTVSFDFTDACVVSVAVEATTVSTGLSDLVKDGYVAYDIKATYASGVNALTGKATVTLPLPEGVTNPVVFYVSDDGSKIEKMTVTGKTDTTVTFETTHFSTFVVGESTEITVLNPTTATVTGATTSEEKTVYVLVDAPEANGNYLIVSNDYALVNSSGSATGVAVTDQGEITINGATYEGYIELDNTNAVWTAASGYTFKNGDHYLGYSTSSSGGGGGGGGGGTSYSVGLSTSTSHSWTYNNNNNYLYVTTTSSGGGGGGGSNSTNRYIYYGSSGWSLSSNTSGGGSNSSSRTVYLYKEVTYDEVTSANGTYSIAGNPSEISKVVVEGTTTTLGSTLTFVPESGTTTTTDTSTTATYTVVDGGDPNGIISGISGNTVTFTGKYGKALVKVSYTVTVNGTDYPVDNYIVVTATAPVYDIEISQDGTTAANDIIAVRGVTENQELELSYILTYEDADGVKTLTPDSGITWYCYLPSGADASAIASIDQTGKLTFTGAEGTIKVMVSYETKEGTSVTDIITINVRESTAVTPDESTTDFPRWPDEGAVRFDKTATAVGNFSETGIAQVELSMAGIPVKTGGAVDVVVMLDMTGSMSDNGMAAAVAAAKAFVEKIVKNSDGTYNDSRVAVYQFNSAGVNTYFALQTISSDTELTAAKNKIVASQASGGTPFDTAAAYCQDVLTAAKTTNLPDGVESAADYDRQQFCVFMSDGGPTSYRATYSNTNGYLDISNSGSGTSAITNYMTGYSSSTSSSWSFTLPSEYYTDQMKADGVTIYTVGLLLQNAPSNPSPYSSMTNSTYDSTTDTLTSIGSHYYFTSAILKQMASDESKYIDIFTVDNANNAVAKFESIAEEINAAATNVEVEDAVGKNYDIIFELPSAFETEDEIANAGLTGQEFYIEVVDYPLDETTHERTGTSTIKQRIYLATDDAGKVYISKIVEDGVTVFDLTDADTTNDTLTIIFEAAGTDEKAYFGWTDSDGDGVADDGEYSYNPDGEGTHHMTSGAYITLKDDGKSLASLHTMYFTYDAGSEKLYWTVTSMSETSEIALRYFVYLDSSGGVTPADQIAAGTYYTNEYATLTYTNHLGTECEQTFPVPQMTWNGAQVSYVFYLVNENGVPVNRAGREITFAEAIFVTDVYTEAVIWNDLEQSVGLEAEYLASSKLPSDYTLYDSGAQYKIHVYEDEKGSNLNNHFAIVTGFTDFTTVEGVVYTETNDQDSDYDNLAYTTYVYNNKSDITKYKTPGTYAASNTYLCKSYSVTATVENGVITTATYTEVDGENQVAWDALESTSGATQINGHAYYVDENGDVYTIVKKTDATAVTGFDFANTTVAFAVVWEKKLVADTVVVDFGLPVDIDVTSNDFVYNYVTGIGEKAPNYVINTGYQTDAGALTAQELTISGHSVEIHDQNHIRFTPGTMEFDKPVEFYYETTVEVYEKSQVVPSYMYSKVTVIPATTVYYEDSYVTYTNSGSAADGYGEWTEVGTAGSATQDQDRPGESQISEGLDADNNYGYDSAYTSMSTWSMGSSHKVTVKSGVSGMASFSFYGTGFDVISMTDSTCGSIVVNVYDANNALVKSLTVNNYYGYAYVNGEWVAVDSNNPNALYQVPVMKVEGLTYGNYTVKIVANYNSLSDVAGAGSYSFYLDAIRIYDPTGVVSGSTTNGVVSGAYEADGEAWPEYTELRNQIIDAKTFNSLDEDTVSGIVFIDGTTTTGAGNKASVSDYTNYGPNNELYLAAGQSIATNLNATASAGSVKSVQLGIKSVGGAGSVEVYGVKDDGTKVECLSQSISTATDMYYDITALNGMTLVIKNSGDSTGAIISLTNIKVTFTQAPVYPVSLTVENGKYTVSYSDNSEKEVNASELKTVENEDGTVTYSYSQQVNTKTYTVSTTVESSSNATVEALSVTASGPKTRAPMSTDSNVSTTTVTMSVASLASSSEETTYLLSVTAESVAAALASLNKVEEEEPETTEPEATEPEATEPEATEPEATEPEATEPEATEPEATEPEETEPEETKPGKDENKPGKDENKPGNGNQQKPGGNSHKGNVKEKLTNLINSIWNWLIG